MPTLLRRYVRIYFQLAAQHIKARLAYRLDFAISLVGMLAMNLTGFLVLWLIFKSIVEINGWEYSELLFIYAFALFAMLPFQLCFENIWNLGSNLMSGRFLNFYLRPLDVLFYYVAEQVDIKAFGQLIVASVLLVYSISLMNVSWGVMDFIVLALLLFSSSLVLTGIMLLASSIGFWIGNPSFALLMALRMKDCAHYPMSIYNGFFKIVFTFIVPIGYIAYYPAQLILRPSEAGILSYLSPLVGGAFFVFSYFVWIKGARRYEGTGT